MPYMIDKMKTPLREIDEKDAGTGDLFDIFSMEFEGDSSGEKPVESDGADSASVSPEVNTEPTNTQEGSEPATDKEPSAETVPPEENSSISDKATEEPQKKPEVPTNEALLADALKTINLLSQQNKAREVKESIEKEESEDDKIFKERAFSDYTFNISPKLYNGLFNPDASEEERVLALQGFASGIATSVHNNIINSIGKWTRTQFEAVPRVVNYLIGAREANMNSARSIREDFYSSFPSLNKPELVPLIKATIQSVQKETQATKWTPQIKNLVGTRIQNVLAAYAQSTSGVTNKTPPKTIKTGATPPVAKPTSLDPNSPESILDVLNSEF